MKFVKFPSIESFAHIIRGQQRFETQAKVKYGAKIKLHGTNAAVTCSDDGVVSAQSRSRIITPSSDNLGFALWVRETVGEWSAAFNAGPAGTVTFFGEWAGNGIQKGDAVCQLEQKYFFVFAVQVDDDVIVSPQEIGQLIPDLDNVLVLPWDRVWHDELDLGNTSQCEKRAEEMTTAVAEIGERDPFIHGIFDLDGPGEGWVVVPLCMPGEDPDESFSIPRDWYSSLSFKVKTEAHAVKKAKPAAVEVEVPQSVHDFVSMFVTDARCEQGFWEEIGGVAEKVHLGRFLKWMGQDIKKESVAELEDSGLEWKDVTKHVTNAAKAWFLKKCEEW